MFLALTSSTLTVPVGKLRGIPMNTHFSPFCALAWKKVSHAPYWPVVSILIISAVFLVLSSLGCASMRWASITSRDTLALIASAVPEAILTNPFSVKFSPRATSCLGIRLAPVAQNSPLQGQNLKTSDSSPGTPKRLCSFSR